MKASVSLVFRKDKLNKKQKAPIHLRVIKAGKIRYISTGEMLEIKHWDFDKNKVKSSHRNSVQLNAYLLTKLTALNDEVLELERLNIGLTTPQLKEKINGKKATEFFVFAEEANSFFSKSGKIGSFDKNKSIIKKLKTYMGESQLLFQNITPEFLMKYENYLRVKLDNSINTIHRDMKFIRKIINDAIRQEIIEPTSNPFQKYKLKQEKTSKTYLTEEELKAFEAVYADKSTRLELHKDMFIFACNTAGPRVSDILQLRWVNFDGTYLHINVQKTKSQISVKVPSKILVLLNKYRNQDSKPGDFIFPALPNDLITSDPHLLDSGISRATALYNKNLITLAEKAGITKRISSHTARHTWATRALRKGVAIQYVSKLLTHTNLAQTQVYAQIVGEELDKAMDVFND